MATNDTIQVRSAIPPKPDGGHLVVLHEVDQAHPGGEAFVAGPHAVEVARTARVQRGIADGTLEVVAEPATTAKPKSDK